MTKDDREFLKEFARAFAFTSTVMGVFLLFVFLIGKSEGKPEDKYKVVDHYGTCAVVRYTDDTQRWHYFLDCREVR